MSRFIQKLLFGDPINVLAIPLVKARICGQCGSIVGEQICPVCTSKTYTFAPRVDVKLADSGEIQKAKVGA